MLDTVATRLKIKQFIIVYKIKNAEIPFDLGCLVQDVSLSRLIVTAFVKLNMSF